MGLACFLNIISNLLGFDKWLWALPPVQPKRDVTGWTFKNQASK